MKKLLLLLVALLTSTLLVDGQEWEFTNVIPVNDIVEGNHTFDKTSLSPDGNLLAWIEQENFCIHELINDVTNCYSWIWDSSFMNSQIGYTNLFLQWSPNSQYIALAQDPFFQRYDSDIWIFDIAEETFINLTEDNISGQTDIISESGLPNIDYMPLWISSDELVFFRTTPVQNQEDIEEIGYFYQGVHLFHVSLETKQPRLLLDLSNDMLPGNSSATISPTSNLLAVISPEIVDNPLQNRKWALWLIDLGNLTTVQISAQDDWEVSMPDNYSPILAYPSSNRSIGWSFDNNSLFISLTWTTEQNTLIPTQLIINLEDFTITSVINYSDTEINNESQLFSFVTIIHYQSPSVGFIALSTENGQFSLYDLTSLEYLEIVEYIPDLTDGIVRMSQNGNVLLNETTLMIFDALQME